MFRGSLFPFKYSWFCCLQRNPNLCATTAATGFSRSASHYSQHTLVGASIPPAFLLHAAPPPRTVFGLKGQISQHPAFPRSFGSDDMSGNTSEAADEKFVSTSEPSGCNSLLQVFGLLSLATLPGASGHSENPTLTTCQSPHVCSDSVEERRRLARMSSVPETSASYVIYFVAFHTWNKSPGC